MASPVELTPRQRQVARLIHEGFTYAEIGERLGVSARTVEGHATRLKEKLGERSARRAASRARAKEPRSKD